MKFLKTGSDACSAAIRIARAHTWRDRVLSAGYHGWSDAFVSLTPPALGVPPCYQDIETYRDDADLSDVAAVIIEPVDLDHSSERLKWLAELRERCTEAGALLVFDEIITGFRFPKFSVAGWSGVTPDLICLGKALAGGMPLSAVGGKYDVMNGAEYFVSSTYAGEILSLVAAKAAMTEVQTRLSIEDLWLHGQRFIDAFNAMLPGQLEIRGYPTRGRLFGDAAPLFMQEACKAGMLFGPSWWFTFPMIDVYREALGTIRAITTRIRNGEVKLEGEAPRSPFAQKVREAKT